MNKIITRKKVIVIYCRKSIILDILLFFILSIQTLYNNQKASKLIVN